MQTPALVYVGGSYPQLRAIADLRAAGFAVVLVDRNRDAPGTQFANEHIVASATDSEAVVHALHGLLSAYDFIGAYGIADYAIETVAAIHEAFGIRAISPAVAKRFTLKHETKALLLAAGLPVPESLWGGESMPDRAVVDQIIGETKMSGGWVVKPQSANNSQGVKLGKTRPELERALSGALAMSAGALVERKVPGIVVNVDGIMAGGEYHPVSTTWRMGSSFDAAVCTAMVQPADLWSGFVPRLHELAEAAARALGYRDGPLTVDTMADVATKSLWCLEVSPHHHSINCEMLRGNGAPITAFARYLNGDEGWDGSLPGSIAGNALCYQRFGTQTGCVDSLRGETWLTECEAVLDHTWLIKPGETSAPGRCVALIWAEYSDRASLDTLVADIESQVDIVVSNHEGS